MPGHRPLVVEEHAGTRHTLHGIGRYVSEAGTPRLLMVHPDPAALAMLGSMLRSSRYEIIEETSGPEALQRLAYPPCLVLIGVNPDEPNSLELLTYVRRKHPRLPTVLLFSTTHPDRSRQALRMGATAILETPVTATQLRATVTRALESSEKRPQAGEVRQRAVGSVSGVRVGKALPNTLVAQLGMNLRPLKEALEGPEREIIFRTLKACNGNRQETAKALDINRTTLYKKMRRYSLLHLTLWD